MIALQFYEPEIQNLWDSIVTRSINGNFLHLRPYMDYHAHRFIDASLVISRRDEPCAVFPACRVGDAVISHAGLSYGGLIRTGRLAAVEVHAALAAIRDQLNLQNVARLVYRTVPTIFHHRPAEEDSWVMHRLGGRLVRRDLGSVIDLAKPRHLRKGRRAMLSKARQAGLLVSSNANAALCHRVISEALARHGTSPVHSVAEMELLMARFPKHITGWRSHHADETLAVAVVYDFGACVHTQYLAATEAGRSCGALDLLIESLATQHYRDRRWLSLGTSMARDGQLNAGLIAQKEGFGAGAVCFDTWELST